MKLAALVFLFTGLTIQKEGSRHGHSSYIDAVATMGLAKLVVWRRGGYESGDRGRVGPGHALWEFLPSAEGRRREETLAMIDRGRRGMSEADRETAAAVWKKLEEYLEKLAASTTSRSGASCSTSASTSVNH